MSMLKIIDFESLYANIFLYTNIIYIFRFVLKVYILEETPLLLNSKTSVLFQKVELPHKHALLNL